MLKNKNINLLILFILIIFTISTILYFISKPKINKPPNNTPPNDIKKECRNNCNNRGICNTITGVCICDTGLYGDECEICINNNYDPTNGCKTCINNYDPANACKTCINNNYDPTNGCKTCINKGYDPNNDCKTCLLTYFTTNVDNIKWSMANYDTNGVKTHETSENYKVCKTQKPNSYGLACDDNCNNCTLYFDTSDEKNKIISDIGDEYNFDKSTNSYIHKLPDGEVRIFPTICSNQNL
jgi:hypothetical protein